MTKNNNFIPIENKKPSETVYELKNEVPSYEEFMKTYEGNVNYADLESGEVGTRKGYGPCKYSLCGCGCSSDRCNCKNIEASRISEDCLSFDNYEAVGRIVDLTASGQVSNSLFRIRELGGDIKLLSVTAGGGIGKDDAKIELSADLINFKTEGVQARLGLAADTGISTEGSLEIKMVGFGFSVGKQTGISTPLGEIKVDTENCVIQ